MIDNFLFHYRVVYIKGRGRGGTVVSVLGFNFDYPSLNPTDVNEILISLKR